MFVFRGEKSPADLGGKTVDPFFRCRYCYIKNRFHIADPCFITGTLQHRRVAITFQIADNGSRQTMGNRIEPVDRTNQQSKQLDKATVKISEYRKEVNTDQQQLARVENPVQAANAQEAIATDNYNEILFYLYGYGILSADNKARLDLLAEHIKKSSSDRVFRIEGFADPQTGTEKCNLRLAEKRARLAYDYLISKGVSESQLEWKSGGTTNLPFQHQEQNRVVVIF